MNSAPDDPPMGPFSVIYVPLWRCSLVALLVGPSSWRFIQSATRRRHFNFDVAALKRSASAGSV